MGIAHGLDCGGHAKLCVFEIVELHMHMVTNIMVVKHISHRCGSSNLVRLKRDSSSSKNTNMAVVVADRARSAEHDLTSSSAKESIYMVVLIVSLNERHPRG